MGWIRIKDRLPEKGQDILVYTRMGDCLKYYGVVKYENKINAGITHWMPLCEPPNEKEIS